MSFGFRSVSDLSDGHLMVLFELVVAEQTFCMVFTPWRSQDDGKLLSFEKDDIQLMKKNASFFCFFWRNEREGISPCWPIVISYKNIFVFLSKL